MPICRVSIVRGGVRWLAAIAISLGLGLGTADAGKRVALVIGNSAYAHLAPLNNPHRDAEAVSALLEALGWDVIKGINLTFVELHDAVTELENKASGAELALVYYAGHGMAHQNRDFVAPIDMPERCADEALLRVIPLDRLFQAVEGAQRKVVILDACRSQPFPNCPKRGVEGSFRGLSRVQSSGLLIVSSTGPGGLAADGPPDAHSPFARVLLGSSRAHPDVYIHELLFKIVKDVSRETKQSQIPELLIKGDPPEICLQTAPCGPMAGLTADDLKKREEIEIARLKALEEADQLRKHLKEDEAKAALKEKRLREEAEDAARRQRELLEKERELRELAERLQREKERQALAPMPPMPPVAPVPPPFTSCGWYAIAYCSQDYSAAQAQTGVYSGYVINTSDRTRYPNFRAGWFCVVQGPMASADAASAAVARMHAMGAATAYPKRSC
jgi:hypothetical protein